MCRNPELRRQDASDELSRRSVAPQNKATHRSNGRDNRTWYRVASSTNRCPELHKTESFRPASVQTGAARQQNRSHIGEVPAAHDPMTRLAAHGRPPAIDAWIAARMGSGGRRDGQEDPCPIEPPTRHPPPSVRAHVRDAIDRAWVRGVASWCAPRDTRGRDPSVNRARAARRRRARRLRQQPRDEARAAVPHGAAGHRDRPRGGARRARPRRPRGRTPVATAEAAPPGFLNLRLADHALEGVVATALADPGAWGRVAGTRPRR